MEYSWPDPDAHIKRGESYILEPKFVTFLKDKKSLVYKAYNIPE